MMGINKITHDEYRSWYSSWRKNIKDHIGNNFCTYFNIDDNILRTTDDHKLIYDKINQYYLFGWDDDISINSTTLPE